MRWSEFPASIWLQVHEDDVLGRTRAEACALVEAVGLVPECTRLGDPITADARPTRIRLFLDGDGVVRSVSAA